MAIDKEFIGISVETLILVAVWERPCIFQGCFKITALDEDKTVLFYFRSKSSHASQSDFLNHEFSVDQYEFTHLYQASGLIEADLTDEAQEDALYLLKYALYVTLKEMLSHRKLHFTSIDDVAMQAFIHRVKPMLQGECALVEEDPVGFAVAMDFRPEEETGCLAAWVLLNQFS